MLIRENSSLQALKRVLKFWSIQGLDLHYKVLGKTVQVMKS